MKIVNKLSLPNHFYKVIKFQLKFCPLFNICIGIGISGKLCLLFEIIALNLINVHQNLNVSEHKF